MKVNNLEFSYKQGKKAVKGLDFDIREGEIFGFLGPSGAGKTTTQKILIGLLRGYTGSVEILGKERRKWGKEYYEKIGVAFEFPNLYQKLTAVENLRLIGSYYKKGSAGMELLLDRVGLLPDSSKKVEAFSKGMKMRLNFVRAIMHDPELVFLDEPTSGLDPSNAKIIKDIILELKNRGKTVFLTTHNMTVAEQLCDRVAFIADGEISVIDSPKDLMVKYGSRTVKIEYYNGAGSNTEEFPLASIRDSKGFQDIVRTKEIRTIHSQEATLEDVFIKLTGRDLA